MRFKADSRESAFQIYINHANLNKTKIDAKNIIVA